MAWSSSPIMTLGRVHPASCFIPRHCPNGVLDTARLPVRRLARRRRTDAGGRCCRSGRSRRDWIAVHVAVRIRRLAGAAGRGPRGTRSSKDERDAFRLRTRTGSRLGRLRRLARRPGPLRPRVDARSARTPPRAACASSATCPIYVAAGQRRPPPRTGGSSRTATSQGCRPTSSRERVSCGATRSTTGAAMRAEGYRWWIERFPAHLRARRPDAARPLPRVRLHTGRCRHGAQTAAHGTLAARPGRVALRSGRGRARPVAGRRRGPRRDHASRSSVSGASSTARGWSCSSSSRASVPHHP